MVECGPLLEWTIVISRFAHPIRATTRPVRYPLETLLPTNDEPTSITTRAAAPHDARAMWQMAKESGSLDLNSPYAYVLAGHHFSETSVVGETADGHLAGFVFAYRPPASPGQVFVWQVAVDPALRGAGVARRLLHRVIDNALPLGATSLTATVTPSNDASRRLFQAIARDRGAQFTERPCFGADLFPDGHEPENEILITPLG